MTQRNYNFSPVSVDWGGYDVPALWAMVESEQDWANREQVGAWMRMHDMLVAHQENLQRIKQGVMDRWPPEGSGAAQQFQSRLNAMIKSAQEASYAARSNASALNLLTDALLEARSGIEPLHRAWQSAATQEQMRLNQQARAVMAQADARVVEHGNQFTQPPKVPQPSIESWKPDSTQSQRSSTVPRGGMVPPLEGSSSGPAWGGEFSPVPVSRGGTGPGAGGVTSPGTVSGPGPSPKAWPGPVLTGTPPAATWVAPVGSASSRASASFDAAAAPALPVGGVLPMPPATRGRVPGSFTGVGQAPDRGIEPMAGEEPGRGVAPVRAGGRTPATAGPAMAEGESRTGGLIGGGFGGAGMRPLSTHKRQYPADEEWGLPTGVEPVIQPGPEPDPRTAFDPGPNVIGGHR